MPEGTVVYSIAGHDKDRFYVVVKWQEDRAYIADGKERLLEKPKAKNPVHLRKTNHTLDLDTVNTDKKLRCALKVFNEKQGVSNEQEGGNRLV